ncbi:PREDICTED: aminopeptidase N-like [Trachymyrmex cornetzi]|uniref:aminopeptidase N-like n=1 Tax=Trachymyrmex cornetzi TaxID=471704 RepID=UPI00084EFB83|nr:PREDICTED: aminopeptidase N-like [Trachymyrmex cornetzi]
MNLAQISNSVIFILTIAVLNSEEQNNLNITNYVNFFHYVIPVHYCIQLDYIIYEHIDDKLDNIWEEIAGLKNEYDSFLFRGKTSTTINILRLLIAPYIQERNGMRQLFPCWDQPQLRATFNISIKHPRYYSALSNMPTKFMTYDNYTDSLRTYFYITPQMSTFQIGIVMTEYQSIKINKNITLWCDCDSEERRPKFEFARRIMNNITLQLKSEFGGIIIPKMDHIAIPNFPQDSISKLGLIFHSEANLIYDETLDTVIRKMEVARLIAPKISYQWFSNLLSSDWSHLWLHDALATMFGEEAVVKSFNNSEILDLFIIQNQYESLHLDSHFNMNPVETTRSSDINSIFSFPRYMKAIIVLRMFRSAITDEVFRNNVHAYISRHYNTTSYGKWLIPITLREISSLNENMWKICLKPNIGSSEFPTAILNKSWMVNIEQAGYYRIKYDSITWGNIAKYLNDSAGDYKSISVINRAKFIDDAFHLMMNRELDVSAFWNLTKFLSQETNFLVWYPMIKVFEYMSNLIPLSREEIEIADIMEKLKKLLEKPLKTLGYEEHLVENDFVKCLRQEIVKWACIFQFDECEQSAFRKLMQHLGNPEINPLLPWWKHWTYCNGVAVTYLFTWTLIRDTWFKARNHKLLPFLTCFRNATPNTTSSLLSERFQEEGEANLIYDETLDPVMRKMEIARLIAQKIAYQWFSNLLSSDWSYLWLHDALATIFGEEAVVKSFNNSEILDLFIIQNQYESLHLDSHFNMNPVETTRSSDINSIFSFPRYMKGENN